MNRVPAHGTRQAARPAAGNSLSAALGHHRAGRLEAAALLYNRHLRTVPDDPDALHLLGLVAAARGEPGDAVELIGRSLAIRPRFAEGHSNLGNVLKAAGRTVEAAASYRSAIQLRPGFAAAHSNLGLLLCEQGRPDAGAASCARAVELDPRNATLHANLGHARRRLGTLEAAEVSHRRARDLDPSAIGLQIGLANILVELRRFEDAAACFREAVGLDPAAAAALRGLATCLAASNQVAAAEAQLRHAVQLHPADAALWNDLGRCLLALGQGAAAVQAFQRAVAIDPDFADAYRNLAHCRQLAADSPALHRVAVLADRTDLPDDTRAASCFALGKVLDENGRYDEAFAIYDKGNRLYRRTLTSRFDAAALTGTVDRLIARFTPDICDGSRHGGNASDRPVFVVGMPRSGTSLVEQIAASHSRVFGAGELRAAGIAAALLGPVENGWTEPALSDASARYLQRLAVGAEGAERVIDKMPDNIFLLGMIARLFPAARVIFCRRDPRDIGLSCYFQNFSAGQAPFSYDLADCGHRIHQTERVARYWRSALQLRCLDVQYEALVADLERESRRLIGFLGLDWEPSCLDFHRTRRVVQTASNWQVRQPLYVGSAGRWRHYERHLGPLLATL